jgi:hypothetical protein
MGGSSGGPRRIGDVKDLIERAKDELRGTRNVFISFAYEDLNEVNLLRGQAKNENSPLEFNDWSVSEPYDSERASYIKQRISERIAQSSVTVVYLSPHSATSKWVEWEISQSLAVGKKVVGVYSGQVKPAFAFPAISQNGITCVPWSELAATIKSLQ